MKLKTILSTMLAAGLVGAGGAVIAEPAKATIRLTDAQMDQVVAGHHFNESNVPEGWTFTDSTSGGTTTYYRGYSTKELDGPPENGKGWSSITTGGTTIRTHHPQGDGGLNNPHVFSVNIGAGGTTTSGPGNSPSDKIFEKQGRL
jgi:hypothetical protein